VPPSIRQLFFDLPTVPTMNGVMSENKDEALSVTRRKVELQFISIVALSRNETEYQNLKVNTHATHKVVTQFFEGFDQLIQSEKKQLSSDEIVI
jgi:hypothetical protein